jgi:two-component system, NtrC family, nitrogen regulation sensor histidine kinase GlnL
MTITPDRADDVLATLPMALLVIDPDLRVRELNAQAEAVLNMSASLIVGQPLNAVLDLPGNFKGGDSGPFAAFDVDFETRRRQKLRADLHMTPLIDNAGWQLLTIANARDHGLGSGLERQGNSRTAIAIAATLAHEIKNPLSGIRGAAQLLDGRVAEADAAMTLLIRTEVDRIAALIDRMEGFTDTRPIDVGAHNIHSIIDHSRQVAEQGFGSELVYTEEYDPSLPPVRAHKDSLIQIVINLLKNVAETAVDGKKRQVTLATRYRHGVAISVKRGEKRVPLPIELCVIDDGPGAPPELVDQLFDPFVSGKRKGQGLGLALADKLVRDMGGLIQYSREGSPPRTVFRLLLQRAEEGLT